MLLAGLCEGFGVGERVLGEDGFGLCVLVGLPGEHPEGVALKPVVVESFSRVMVVDVSVGGFGEALSGLWTVLKVSWVRGRLRGVPVGCSR